MSSGTSGVALKLAAFRGGRRLRELVLFLVAVLSGAVEGVLAPGKPETILDFKMVVDACGPENSNLSWQYDHL
jgi:hypothetical protein